MTDSMQLGSGSAVQAEQWFRDELELMEAPRILELGTLRWETNRPTHHIDWKPTGIWTRSDVKAGEDVDVVADAHDLWPLLPGGSFDAYLAVSVYEHLRRPWIAARQACQVLKPGGILLVVTHQTFPLHGYPDDYFRFSAEALAGVFEDAGLDVSHAGYQYPCQILPPSEVTRWNGGAEAYLNVAVSGRRA